MKWTVLVSVLLVSAIATGDAMAQPRHVRCREWAREQVRRQPTPAGGALRGAALGVVGGAILGRPGIGAAAGAGLGAAHSADRRHRSFEYFYDRCMWHWH